MQEYYWFDGKKIGIKRVPGSFGIGLANSNVDLALALSDYFIDEGYTTSSLPKRLMINGPDLDLNKFRSLWPKDKVSYATYVYQKDKSRIFPTDELRVSSEQLSAADLERLENLVGLGLISEIAKRNYDYECKILNPDGDKGIKVYQHIYEVLGLPVDINWVRIVQHPGKI